MKAYRTRDIQLAAILICEGFELTSLDKHESSSAQVFVFQTEKFDEIKATEADYIAQKLKVEPRKLFTVLGSLSTWVDTKNKDNFHNK